MMRSAFTGAVLKTKKKCLCIPHGANCLVIPNGASVIVQSWMSLTGFPEKANAEQRWMVRVGSRLFAIGLCRKGSRLMSVSELL